MNIYCHRGYWKNDSKLQNSLKAIIDAQKMNWHSEIDVRDNQGALVVSHDPPISGCNNFYNFEDIVQSLPDAKRLALNIKSCGLNKIFSDEVINFIVTSNSFLFDATISDMMAFAELNLPFYTRVSDLEQEPVLLKKALGIVIDTFHSTWWSVETILKYLDLGYEIMIISPELHDKAHQHAWEVLKSSSSLMTSTNISVCTDFPLDANNWFNEV